MRFSRSESFGRHAWRLWLLAAAIAVALVGQAAASSVPLTLEQLMAVSDEVVAVRVQSSESKMTSGRIYTTAKLKVVERFKGNLKGETEITYLGGQWGHVVMAVPAVPKLNKGEEAILFLSKPLERLPKEERAKFNAASPLVNSFQIVGGHQGKFTIVNNAGETNAKELKRAGDEAIPSNQRVMRKVTSNAGTDDGARPDYESFRGALRTLASENERKAREKGVGDKIAGIRGTFAVPERSADPVVRAFDPLPKMAYLDDEGLTNLKEEIRKKAEAAPAQGDADSVAEPGTPQQ